MKTLSQCPALLIAAPSSGQGKTLVTGALARHHRRLGRQVRVFKCGPDFLDPQILTVACGAPVYNLDLGMGGEADVASHLASAAQDADLILVEGVMGLFDGRPSAADIACRFKIPVLGLIDASAMAQTFGAMAHGLASYRPELPFAGVLANRVGSPHHAELLRNSLPPGIAWFGALTRDDAVALPERHLGLWQADEIDDLEIRLDLLADQIANTTSADLPPKVEFPSIQGDDIPPLLAGRTIAIARDAAFSFIYPANLDALRRLGATLCFFSPLAGDPLPSCDALWLPGGYPELHAPALARRHDLWQQLTAHHAEGKPLLAECGGMMSLFESLVDQENNCHPLAGLLPGSCVMGSRLAGLGLQQVNLPEGTLRGHTFHYSRCETPLKPYVQAHDPDGKTGEAIYRLRRLTASYVHFYFPSNPVTTALLFLPLA
ncbi:cobyrinic acid a,c-diamide synthase [Denitratisoma sp. DHT3]|uniref:cobyrinate a,c-diamide synthase n=1 Tax=Denitratisoma sp. DHT3 TaxID=1981880 RepID=UPI001198BDB4|nr:cobyrinate a,c-diamide synthase [Denitratisoma sp. DHT3]QDX81631.1 cobyrinic acid a,c-diamide synthase [Denitratisoma sp. DHT3]